jgi:hypothetical protein
MKIGPDSILIFGDGSEVLGDCVYKVDEIPDWNWIKPDEVVILYIRRKAA